MQGINKGSLIARSPDQLAAIEAGPVGTMIYNVGADGLPMVKESFGNSFAAIWSGL